MKSARQLAKPTAAGRNKSDFVGRKGGFHLEFRKSFLQNRAEHMFDKSERMC